MQACPQGQVHPNLSRANTLAPLHNTALHWIWGNHDQGKDLTMDTEETQSQGEAWVGQQWPLLVLTQAVTQKQPRSLTAASPSQLCPGNKSRGHVGPS